MAHDRQSITRPIRDTQIQTGSIDANAQYDAAFVHRQILSTAIRFSLFAILLASSGGCSHFDLLNAATPVRGFGVVKDIAYDGSIARRKLDVYTPHDASDNAMGGRRPVIIFFYGGYWTYGEKREYLFAAQAFTSRGFVVVIPDYRLVPNIHFPAFVEDGAAAVKWTTENISTYGGDPGRIYLVGHSAGAHIAALLALDAHYLKDVGLSTSVIRAAAPMSGPYDFMPPDYLRFAFNMTPEQTEPNPKINPVKYARADAPPMLLVHGGRDMTVKIDNAESLYQHLHDVGASVQLANFKSLGHIGIVLSLAFPFRWRANVADEIAAFFNAHP